MKVKFRIGLNLLHVIPGEVGGSENYSIQILKAVDRYRSIEIEPVLFVLESFQEAHTELCERFETVTCKINGNNRFKRIIAESTWLKIKTRRCDAVHHFGGRLPLWSKKPNLVTIHDLQPLEKPHNFSLIKRIFFRYTLPLTIKKAGMLVAVSDSVKQQLIEIFEINSKLIHIVSTGIEEVAEKPNSPKEPLTIFYPAATYPHKNHRVLIDAFNRIAEINSDVRLVMSGGEGRAEEEVRKSVSISPVKERIFLTGRISSMELEAILKSSAVLAFPSTYEGFGIPVLEAMASGVPVVVAKGTPAEKLPGGKSLKVEPYEVDDWVAALEILLADGQLREEIAKENIEIAKSYTWDFSAEQLILSWNKLNSLTKDKNCVS